MNVVRSGLGLAGVFCSAAGDDRGKLLPHGVRVGLRAILRGLAECGQNKSRQPDENDETDHTPIVRDFAVRSLFPVPVPRSKAA